uniref:Peptidase S54 rhomboid domain-containing protein n=1 Tax=Setaria digitata TaxID=48799 RepID=A0A915Q6U7_9BILA
MPNRPDRSHLSLPLESVISTRHDDNHHGDADGSSRPQQQKLIKSLSTPASYSVTSATDMHFRSSSSSNSSKESKNYPPLSRAQSIRDTISSGTAKFFGVPPLQSSQSSSVVAFGDPKWSCRRLRFICKHYGNPKEDLVNRELIPQILEDLSDFPSPKAETPQSERGEAGFIPSAGDIVISRSKSVESRSSRITQQHLERRDSVMKIVCDRLSSIVQRGTLRPKKTYATVRRGRSISSSFAPFSIHNTGNVTHIKIDPSTVDVLSVTTKNMPTVMEADLGNHELVNAASEDEEQNKKKLDVSLFKKSRPAIHFPPDIKDAEHVSLSRNVIDRREPLWSSEFTKPASSVVSLTRPDPRTPTAIEYEMEEKISIPLSSIESIQDEVFFDYISPAVSSNICDSERGDRTSALRLHRYYGLHGERFSLAARHNKDYHESDHLGDNMNILCEEMMGFHDEQNKMGPSLTQKMQPQCSKEQVRHRGKGLRRQDFAKHMKTPDHDKSTPFISLRSALTSPKDWLLQNIQPVDEKTKEIKETCKSIRKRSILDAIQKQLKSKKYYVPHRRRFGGVFGIWRKYFQRTYKKDAYQLNNDTYIDCRPFFTYWITTVQILVTLISLWTYGIGPWGFGLAERTADVLHTTVTLKRVSIYVQQNIWLGPKFADLVHLGAKFTPCMRRDPKIFEQIEIDRREESETGCCIYNDGAGCFQTRQSTCPSLIATLTRWTESNPGPGRRISGAVCGQDPRYCEDPVSVKPYEWPDDMTQWPICKKTTALVPENEKHLHCEITGRPCCIQLHGQCRITTRDYCDFVEGYFHENATLCSQVRLMKILTGGRKRVKKITRQVSCLSEVCGMLPFLRRNQPDQWYRLFIPLFLHAGIIHCILTVFIQLFYMRDLEKFLGWARVALIYMVSGVGGYMGGAIFVPYKPEVGPAGSHVGMFAAMYVDVVYSWNLLERPWHALTQLSLFTVALFAMGTLPWVDNWAHLFGFIFGILISLAVLPYIQTKRHNRAVRLLIVIASLSTVIGLFVILLALFYLPSNFDCPYCEYFNCIPYTDHFCDNQGLRLKNWLPI